MAGPLPMDQTFEARIMERIETLQRGVTETQTKVTDLSARIDAADNRSREAMVRIEQERSARSSEITQMQTQIEQIGRRTSDRFDELAKKLNEIGDLVARLSGKMDGWDDLLNMREELTRANTQRIESLENGNSAQDGAIALLTSNHAGMLMQVKALDVALHGDSGKVNGPANVFGTLRDLGEQMKAGFDKLSVSNETALMLGRETVLRVERLEAAQKEREVRWSKWGARLATFFQKVLGSRIFWVGITSVTGIYAVTPQEIKSAIGEFLTILLGGPQ